MPIRLSQVYSNSFRGELATIQRVVLRPIIYTNSKPQSPQESWSSPKPTIEPESILIEVSLQVLVCYSPFMSAGQPTFDVGNNEMNER